MDENLIKFLAQKDPKLKTVFLGCFARDELPDQPPFPSCFILNTDPRSRPGEHWLAFYYTENGFCNFFDSFALPPSYYRLESYLNRTSTGWESNKKRLQGFSDLCGIYAILFLLYRVRNKSIQFYKEFYSNCYKNDKKIFDTFKMFIK